MAIADSDMGEPNANGIPDFDPEGDANPRDEVDDDSDFSEEADAGTEHYVAVGPSRLRQKQSAALGPHYRGSRISRATLDESSDGFDPESDGGSGSEENSEESGGIDGAASDADYDDLDAVDLDLDHDRESDKDEEIDSDEAFGESDAEKFKSFTFAGSSKPAVRKRRTAARPVAADFLSSEEDDEAGSSVAGEEDEDEDEEDEDANSATDESDDDGRDGTDIGGDQDDERAEMRRIMAQGQGHMADRLSQAVKADAEKGMAVRQQRRVYDSLLNLRIRLQKALVAANSFNVALETKSVADESYSAAEDATLKLLSSLVGISDDIARSGDKAEAQKKRKRDIRSSMSNQEIWDLLQSGQDVATAKRRKVLDKWSARVLQTATQPTTTRKLGTAPRPQSLGSVLDEQLSDMSRLVKRTQTPRSCAPVQAARKMTEDPSIYDDADFYQLLLKELVEQRASDSSAPAGSFPTSISWAALKDARTRKKVDRKASKGRKLRFNVHEKLQNFMAPEDRTTWEPNAVDRFFGALFGRKPDVVNDEDGGSDEDIDHVETTAEEGLRLFGS